MKIEISIPTCPRCGDPKDFMSKELQFSSDIIKLSDDEKAFIKELYSEEICIPCLVQLKKKFQIKSHSHLL